MKKMHARILDAHNISKKKTNAKNTNEVCNFAIKNVDVVRNIATSIYRILTTSYKSMPRIL
jgi:hypothetical protein